MDGWYRGLAKPPGTPPGAVFGVVWPLLYLLMGVALGRLIDRRAWAAVGFFAFQFALNLIWTPVFFNSHQVPIALGIILGMLLGIALTIGNAWRADRPAAWLLVPYFAWVAFATYLNGGIFWLNF
jgi:tryptophan-rich sensory protein